MGGNEAKGTKTNLDKNTSESWNRWRSTPELNFILLIEGVNDTFAIILICCFSFHPMAEGFMTINARGSDLCPEPRKITVIEPFVKKRESNIYVYGIKNNKHK